MKQSTSRPTIHRHVKLFSRDFWESPTLDELAQAQNAKPIENVETLLGGWPGDVGDDFEEENRRIRQSGIIGDDRRKR